MVEEIVKKLHEGRRVEHSKSILESAGYRVEKIQESWESEAIDKSIASGYESFDSFDEFLKSMEEA